MTRFDTWESYFYPATYNPVTGHGTLRNLFDERDEDVLRTIEYGVTLRRGRQLELGQVVIPRTYDAGHVCAIHRHLFQDVYEWAGQYRTVNMAKGAGREFGDVMTGEVDRYLGDVQRLVLDTQWGRLDRAEFGAKAAEVFSVPGTSVPGGQRADVESVHGARRPAVEVHPRLRPGDPGGVEQRIHVQRPGPGLARAGV